MQRLMLLTARLVTVSQLSFFKTKKQFCFSVSLHSWRTSMFCSHIPIIGAGISPFLQTHIKGLALVLCLLTRKRGEFDPFENIPPSPTRGLWFPDGTKAHGYRIRSRWIRCMGGRRDENKSIRGWGRCTRTRANYIKLHQEMQRQKQTEIYTKTQTQKGK